MTITYKDAKKVSGGIDVFLDGRKVGNIQQTGFGWRYIPKDEFRNIGAPFTTLAACKASLESA